MTQMIAPPPITIPLDRQARLLFFGGWSQTDIAERLATPISTVNYWKTSQKWDAAPLFERCESAAEARYVHLLTKEPKSGGDLKELDAIGRQLKGIFFQQADKPSKKRATTINSNDFDADQFKQLCNEKYIDELYDFQRIAMEKAEKAGQNKISAASSFFVKSRQIGFTKTLAETRLMRLLNMSHDQIYISASLRQSLQANRYIKKFIRDATGMKMEGTELMNFHDGLRFHFLGSNASTAQGDTGDVTMDEVFWMTNFDLLMESVSAAATLSQYNVVLSSTVSSKQHPAYQFWTGSEWNKNNKDQRIITDHKTLKNGRLGADGYYRQIITIEDAVNSGYDLVDIDRQKRRYGESAFARLYMCEFVDDKDSVFNYNDIMRAMVDSMLKWNDFWLIERPLRPFGNKPVAIGYDPARDIHASSCTVWAVPHDGSNKYRLLERFNWNGQDYDWQTDQIYELTKRYNVVHIGMDGTGLGLPIAARIRKFFPMVEAYHSNPALKNFFVMRAINHFKHNLVEFDAEDREVGDSFLSIRQVSTRSGNNLTYESDFSEETFHADDGWSSMYAWGFEEVDGTTKTEGQGRVFSF